MQSLPLLRIASSRLSNRRFLQLLLGFSVNLSSSFYSSSTQQEDLKTFHDSCKIADGRKRCYGSVQFEFIKILEIATLQQLRQW